MASGGLLSRLILFAAGLAGALGILALAAGAHGSGSPSGGGDLTTAGWMLTIHAGVLVAIATSSKAWRLLRFSGLIIGAGAWLFGGDLIWRDFVGEPLFTNAAPTGGMLLIAGWLILALSALLPNRQAERRVESYMTHRSPGPREDLLAD